MQFIMLKRWGGEGLSAKIMTVQFPVHSLAARSWRQPSDQFQQADSAHLSSICIGKEVVSGSSRNMGQCGGNRIRRWLGKSNGAHPQSAWWGELGHGSG